MLLSSSRLIWDVCSTCCFSLSGQHLCILGSRRQSCQIFLQTSPKFSWTQPYSAHLNHVGLLLLGVIDLTTAPRTSPILAFDKAFDLAKLSKTSMQTISVNNVSKSNFSTFWLFNLIISTALIWDYPERLSNLRNLSCLLLNRSRSGWFDTWHFNTCTCQINGGTWWRHLIIH